MPTQTTSSIAELGSKNIGKLLQQYAIPSIIAMTAMSLYNITDSVFIGHGVGALGISGLAICFPLMNLAAAFGSLVGVGSSTLLSIRMGQKDYDTGNKILGNLLIMNVVFGGLFGFTTLVFLKPILYFFGASSETLPYAYDFMSIILAGNIVTHMYMGLNALLRSSGLPRQSMYATIFTVLINVVLNPLFIFVFKWGMHGSAIATIISQFIMLIYQLKLFSNKDNFIHIHKKIFRVNLKIIKDTLSIGVSPFMMNSVACLVVIVINQGLINYGGDLSVGAYGIVNRIAFLFVMIVFGINQGMQPIAGYNYGAKLYPRVTSVLKKSILFASIVMTLGFAVVELFPHVIASLFTTEEELIHLSVNGLRITFLFFPIVGFQMVTTNFFQSIGMAKKSIFLSLSRQLIFLLPCLFILPHFYGENGIWYSLPASDFIASLIALIMLIWQMKKFKKME
ncbi:MAG: MATE family efflux transporter [Paludibacter sp.]|jgi:putative MATE family efflux protein|nr:MATE family efflux transporter [Paludibacter sp.]